jgi:transcriptional regulator with XRE-family HTH domain
MPTPRRTQVELEAHRELSAVLRREGRKVRAARRRRRWTQTELGRRSDLAQTTVSKIERGEGGSLSLESWQQVALVLGLPLDLSLGRDALEEPVDAGHLAIQELVLRLARPLGFARTFDANCAALHLGAHPCNPISQSPRVTAVTQARRR